MTTKQGAGLGCAVAGGLVLLALIGVLLSFAFGWIGGAAETAGFDNSKAQGTQIRQDYESMKVQAETICEIDAADRKASDGDPLIVEDPGVAYKAQYRRAQEDYNRRMSNMFEAGKTKRFAGVGDLPDRAPSVKEMQELEGLC